MSILSDRRTEPRTGAVAWRVMTPENRTIIEYPSYPNIYGYQLQDKPRNGSIVITEDNSGLTPFTETSSNPSQGEFFVNYDNGFILFNVLDDGIDTIINYDGGGSVANIENLESMVSLPSYAAIQTLPEKTSLVVGDDLILGDSETNITKRLSISTLDDRNQNLIDAEIYKINSNKNLIINGNFDIWQRGISQTSSGMNCDDRWENRHNGTTKTHSRQKFSLGQVLVPNNPKYFSRTIVNSVASSNNYCDKFQKIKDVTKSSGRKIVVSFYADVDSDKNIALEGIQDFGTGGSPSSQILGIDVKTVALTTGFKKYTTEINFPSISGKTLGTSSNDWFAIVFWFDAGSDFDSRTNSLGQRNGTFDLSKIQAEYDFATEYEEKTAENTFDDCLPYFEKSWELGTAVGTSTGTGSIQSAPVIGNLTRLRIHNSQFKRKKIRIPDITIYNGGNGAINQVGTYNNHAADNRIVSSISGKNSSHLGVYIIVTSTMTNIDHILHYTANSELTNE